MTQAGPIAQRIPHDWAMSMGFKFYNVDIKPVPLMGVTICLSWASSIILLILLAFRKRNIDLRSLVAIDRSYLSSSAARSASPHNSSSHIHKGSSSNYGSSRYGFNAGPTRLTRFWRVFRRVVRYWGWRFSVVALLAISLFLPSFFSVVLLFTVCLASVVPQATLEKFLVVPAVTIYLIIITSMQYIYNIPGIGKTCYQGEQSALCAVGLRVFDYTWFQIGLQTLACVVLSLNWGYYVTRDEIEEDFSAKGEYKRKHKQLDDSALLDDASDSDVTEGLLLADKEARDADERRHRAYPGGPVSGSQKVHQRAHSSKSYYGQQSDSVKRRKARPGSTSFKTPKGQETLDELSSGHFSSWSGADDANGGYYDKNSSAGSVPTTIDERHRRLSSEISSLTEWERSASRSNRRKEGEVGSSSSSSSSSSKGCCGACWKKLSQWWKDFRPVLKSVGFWALKQSYLLCLGGVYIAGLHAVNILNSMYLLLFILFLISPNTARKAWLLLVLYCELVILLVYTWSATPWTANIKSTKVLSMIGLRTYPSTDELFSQGLVWHLIIMLFAVIQLWVLRYTASLAEKGKDKPTEKIPRWMRAVGNTFFWVWDEYGLIPVYTVLIFVASSDGPISLINLLYITLLFVCLSIHMMTRRADVHIKRFWIFVVVASGVILLARYAYQFPFIQEFLLGIIEQHWIIEGIGFDIFKTQTAFVPLLGNTFVFLVAVIQLHTFFAKKDSRSKEEGVGHNAHARRLATAEDFEFESDMDSSETDHGSDWDDGRQDLNNEKTSSLPGSFKFGTNFDGIGADDTEVLLHDGEHVPLGASGPPRRHSKQRSSTHHVHYGKAIGTPASTIGAAEGHAYFSEDEARILAERGTSGRAERQVSASQHLLMDEELVAEDIRKHPVSTLRQRKRRLRRKHVCETILYTWSLDIIYWLKRFCMLHAYKIAALVMMSIAVRSPSGLNSVYVEIVLLSVSADHLTDGVGLLLLLYTQLTILFVLVYQFAPLHDALTAYLPLVQWAGFEYLPNNRLSLIVARLGIIVVLLLQRFSHRWKNDWYRVKKIEVEHELEPKHMENVELHYTQLMMKHAPSNISSSPLDMPPFGINAESPSESSRIRAAAEKMHQFSSMGSSAMSDDSEVGQSGEHIDANRKHFSDTNVEYNRGSEATGAKQRTISEETFETPVVQLDSDQIPKQAPTPTHYMSPSHANSRYGILQQLQALMVEDARDNEAIDALKSKYLRKTELTLFLYDSSDYLVLKDHFTMKEAWNVIAWFLSNLLLIAAYPVLIGAILITLQVHRETVYGVVFLLLLGLTVVTSRSNWSFNGLPIKFLTVYVALEILLQYILNLDLPPPDLRYPWWNMEPAWLAWLGLKQMNARSGMLVADFVLLLVLARIRRISREDNKQLQWSRYWHYLVGPVVNLLGERRTWRDSVRYAIYRFSPFVILLLVFIAGTIHPDLLSLIYVFFALLFIFRESTIYAQRNKIWRWARLYNFLLMLAILLYQIPAIKSTDKVMSWAKVIGLQKFRDGGSILFSIFIFILLGVQKRLFSRIEFDELVLSILDEEEKGVRLAQDKFQEWKRERREELELVQEEKRKRRQQLDFLKAARTRQQKLWLRLAKGGAASDGTILPGQVTTHSYDSGAFGPATLSANPQTASSVASQMPPQEAIDLQLQQAQQHAQKQQAAMESGTSGSLDASPSISSGQVPHDYVHNPRMRTITSRDLKLLQSAGGLAIEEDPQAKGQVKLKFKTPATSTMASSKSQTQISPSTGRKTQTIQTDDLDEIVVRQRALSPLSGAETGETEEGESEYGDSEAIEEGDAEHSGRKRRSARFGDDGDDSTSDSDQDGEEDSKDRKDGDDEEEDVLAAALKDSRKPGETSFGEDDEIEAPTCCKCWKTPQFVVTGADIAISWLDKHTEGYLSSKPHYGRSRKLWAGIYKMYQINSSALCYLFFIVNCAVNSDVLSLFYPLSMFLYALLETPRPHKLFWNTTFVYAAMTILVKFFYQFSIFCVCHADLRWALASRCALEPACLATFVGKSRSTHSQFRFSLPRVTGITSYNDAQGGSGGSFILHVVPDLLVLISVFMHRYWLKRLGYWNFVQRLTLSKEIGGDGDDPASQKQLHDEAKRFEEILLKQQKKRENWTRYAANKRRRRYNKRMEALARRAEETGADPSTIDVEAAAHMGEYWNNSSSAFAAASENAHFASGVEEYGNYGDTDDERAANVLKHYNEGDEEYDFDQTSPKEYRRQLKRPLVGPNQALTSSQNNSLQLSANLLGPSNTTMTPSGLKVVSNPLFKAGESDFETDTEEMTHVGSHSGASGDYVSDILGSKTSDQATRRGAKMTQGAAGIVGASAASGSGFGISRKTDTSEEDEESGEEGRTSDELGSEAEYYDDDEEEGSSGSSDFGDEDEEENLYADTRALRRKRALANVKRRFRAKWRDFKNFFENLVAHKPGRDWYVHMWFVELLCFFFIIILPNPFIGNAGGNVIEFLTQSRLPNSYVLTLLGQFILIIIERVLYLFRAIKVKVAYHAILVVFYHVWLLFVVPLLTSEDFRTQPILISFYLLKMAYLYLSSMQIMHGYPAFVQGQFLTDSNDPGMLRWLVYIAYRAIPFVYELRTLLDWTTTKTSLTFFEWLKLEDIYANLFLVKCRVSQDKTWKRNVGDPQAWYVKWGMGVLLFAGLSALIWFPLLILMQGSPGNQANPIVAATVSIGFTGYASPIFTAVAVPSNMRSAPNDMSSDTFNRLRSEEPAITYDDYSILQWIEFDNFSDASWLISPPAREHLLKELEDYANGKPGSHANTVSARVEFTRKYAINAGAVADFPATVPIDRTIDVIHAINGSYGNFSISHLLPRYYRIPNSGSAVALNQEDVSRYQIGASFFLGGGSLGNVQTSPPSSAPQSPGTSSLPTELYWNCRATKTQGTFPWDSSERLVLVTFSAEAPKGLLRSLASVGLIGLYVGVVLAVARFLRLSVTDLAFRIIYEDMPACEELISYCEDIYMARQDGDLVLEEELFRELVEIYRSPETIIGRTIRTHPRFAGRPLTKKERRKLLKENPHAFDADGGDGSDHGGNDGHGGGGNGGNGGNGGHGGHAGAHSLKSSQSVRSSSPRPIPTTSTSPAPASFPSSSPRPFASTSSTPQTGDSAFLSSTPSSRSTPQRTSSSPAPTRASSSFSPSPSTTSHSKMD